MCVDCVLALPRIVQVDPGDEPLSEVVLSHVANRAGRVNYTTMEDIPEGGQVLVGTFSLNGYPILILFDSGAIHDFISKACRKMYQLTIESIRTPYMIRTPGGNVIIKQVVMNAPLNLAGKIYKTRLIVLDGQEIDVILGMNLMKERRALLDIASRTMQLHSLEHGVVVIQLSIIVHDKLSSASYHCLET
jgi:hypothetical protein